MTDRCPWHNTELLLMYGCGWDYDRLICPVRLCDYEIELETTSYPIEGERCGLEPERE